MRLYVMLRNELARFQQNEEGGVEKIAAIIGIIIIVAVAIAAIGEVLESWIEDIPEPGDDPAGS